MFLALAPTHKHVETGGGGGVALTEWRRRMRYSGVPRLKVLR